ncbi:MAG: hypothetical protein M1825_002022 [Sarcosagium campestre]|nr:MAG: hypothetical protein M1825_002022 [Sarcosagium campestre]
MDSSEGNVLIYKGTHKRPWPTKSFVHPPKLTSPYLAMIGLDHPRHDSQLMPLSHLLLKGRLGVDQSRPVDAARAAPFLQRVTLSHTLIRHLRPRQMGEKVKDHERLSNQEASSQNAAHHRTRRIAHYLTTDFAKAINEEHPHRNDRVLTPPLRTTLILLQNRI